MGLCTKCNTPVTISEHQGLCGGSLTTFMCGCINQEDSNYKPIQDVERKLQILDSKITKLREQAIEARMKSEQAMDLLIAEIEKESKGNNPNDSSIESRLSALESDVAFIKSFITKQPNKIIKG